MPSNAYRRIFTSLSNNRSKFAALTLVVFAVLAILMLAPTNANAQREGGFERFQNPRGAINMLGWVAIGSGILGTGSFMIYSKLLRQRTIPPITTNGRQASQNGGGRLLAGLRQPLLNFHITVNSIGFFSGMAHGFFLLRGLDIVSLSLAVSMAVALGSGMLLKFGSRRIKFYNFQLHGNISLVILVILLTGMHVLTVRGGD